MPPPTPLLLANPESVIQGSNKSLNFFHDGRFFIHGHFDETIATEIVPFLIQEIEKKHGMKQASIPFYINSPGGRADWLRTLLSLVELAKTKGITVETYVLAAAYSCGSVLACSGSKGHRSVSEHAEHLCHLGYASIRGTANDVQLGRETDRAKAHFGWVRALYRRYAAIPDLEEVIHDDSYFIRGEDIIKNGLADKLL